MVGAWVKGAVLLMKVPLCGTGAVDVARKSEELSEVQLENTGN